MTTVIKLPPEAERRLSERATRHGQDMETAAASLLTEALEWEESDSAEAVDGIQRGLEDFAGGRIRPFSEFSEEQRQKHHLPE